MGNAIGSKTYSYLSDRGADKVYIEGLMAKPAQAAKILKKVKMEYGDYIERNFGGMGFMQETTEGASFIVDEIHQGDSKTIYPVTRTLGFEVKEEAVADDRWGIIKQIPNELGKAVAATDELVGFLPFNQAFAGPRVGLDGQYLCSAAHPDIYGGGTQSNLVVGALDSTTLQEAILKGNNLKTSSGIPASIRVNLLLVAANSSNYWVGKDLVKNEWQYNSADRNLNPIQGEGISLMAVDWLTTSTNWFVLSMSDHDLKIFTRMENTKRKGRDERTGNEYMYVKHRKTADFFNWQGVVGSIGA